MTASLAFHADGYRPGTRHRPHMHGELHLSLVLGGRVSETVGSATEYAGALSVVAKDSGVVHSDDFGTAGAKLARLILPAGTIGALIDDPSRSPAGDGHMMPGLPIHSCGSCNAEEVANALSHPMIPT